MIRIIFLLLCWSTVLFASEQPSFTYLEAEGRGNLEAKAKLLIQLESVFNDHTVGIIPQPFPVDALLREPSHQKPILAKLGFYPSDPKLFNQIIPFDGGLLLHVRTPSGYPYALYFLGHSKTEVEKYGYTLTASFPRPSPSKWTKFSRLLIPVAHAQEDCDPKKNEVVDSVTKQLRQEGKKAYGCLIGVFKGAWDSTGGAVAGLASAIAHPIQTAQEVWASGKKLMSALEAFESDIKGSFEKIYGTLSQIPPEEFAELKCRIASAIGVGALMTYFTVGAGGPAVMLRIAALLEKVDHLYPGKMVPSVRLAYLARQRRADMEYRARRYSPYRRNKVRFFRNNREMPFSPSLLTPGKSYTALIHNGKLVIGEDVLEGGATRGSHVKMMRDMGANDELDYKDRGGAIRVNMDGSIDVAGYHIKYSSQAAADELEAQIRLNFPNAKIRKTRGKLEDLP